MQPGRTADGAGYKSLPGGLSLHKRGAPLMCTQAWVLQEHFMRLLLTDATRKVLIDSRLKKGRMFGRGNKLFP